MTSLSTPLTRMLGIRNPIINAPMTPQAGGALAGAVSDAGGLGMLGFDEEEPSEKIREQLAILKNRVSPNFGIGLVAWVLERRPELLDLAIAASPKMVSISFGDPSPYVARIKEAGILVASQVQSKRWATIALDAGVDVLIAQGTEGGGHTGSVGTLPLLQLVLEMTAAPVAAAGGIASGRGLAAVLAAGRARHGSARRSCLRKRAALGAKRNRALQAAMKRRQYIRASSIEFKERLGPMSSKGAHFETDLPTGGIDEKTT